MLIKTRGIVFRSIKYGETSLIVDAYTEERGLQKYFVNGVRKPKARMNAALFQHMSIVDLVAYARSDRDMNRIKEIRPAVIYQRLPFDVRRGAIGMFITELARKTLREAEENQPLFSFLFNTLLLLDQAESGIANVHLYFVLHLSAFLGFFPESRPTTDADLFDLQEGRFRELPPDHAYYLDAVLSHRLAQLLNTNLSGAALVSLSREQRNRLLDKLLTYYRLHLDNFPEIHAHAVLREIF